MKTCFAIKSAIKFDSSAIAKKFFFFVSRQLSTNIVQLLTQENTTTIKDLFCPQQFVYFF
jgi:hypothetical protein